MKRIAWCSLFAATSYAIILIVLLSIYGKDQIGSRPHNNGPSIVPAICDLIVCCAIVAHYIAIYVNELEQKMKVTENIPKTENTESSNELHGRKFSPINAYIVVVLISFVCTLLSISIQDDYFTATTPLYYIVLVHATIYTLIIAIGIIFFVCSLCYGIISCFDFIRRVISYKCCKKSNMQLLDEQLAV